MSKYVILNASDGNTTKKSMYTLMIAEEISKYLSQNGINNQILKTKGDYKEKERISLIQSNSPNTKDTVVVTIGVNSPNNQEIEILYALRNSDKLASRIATFLENEGFTVSKFYQRRLPGDPSKDYDEIIRETGNRETITIEYGNLASEEFIQNNWRTLAQATAEALATYLEEVGTFYTVQAGDNLYSIARRFDVSVEELKRANNLGTNLLSLGQKLLIPKKQEEESLKDVYVVKKGDTLYSIAQTYGVSVEELKSVNNLQDGKLSIGQRLQIPKTSQNSMILYTVKPKDSLYSIATRYGVSVAELKSINNLSSNLLSIGQELLIPVKTSGRTYVVQKGDSLYTIARKYNISVENLKKANGLESTLLSIGQKLIIPTS